MRSFTLGSLRVDVLQHSRVRNPERSVGTIAEAFELAVFTSATGAPVDLGQGHGNLLTEIWIGRESSPVFAPFIIASNSQITDAQARTLLRAAGENAEWADIGIEFRQVGTKRGGDFRNRFWPEIQRRISKYLVSQALGKRPGDLADSELEAHPLRLRVAAPTNLRNRTINQAVTDLTGSPPRTVTRLPQGTVANIETDHDCRMNVTGPVRSNPADTTISSTNTPQWPFFRFPLAALPTGATVNDSDLELNILAAAESLDVWGYGTPSGDDDPEADSDAACVTNLNAGTQHLNDTTAYNAIALGSADLGATADGEIQGNIDSPDRYTICTNQTSGTDDYQLEALENAGTDPPTLVVDYTAAGNIVILRRRRSNA